MSESPALHLNCSQGLFQGILMDAEDIPELKIDEAGLVLTMLASFLNLNEASPECARAGKETKRAGSIIRSAVKDMGLLDLVRAKFEEKYEAKNYSELGGC